MKTHDLRFFLCTLCLFLTASNPVHSNNISCGNNHQAKKLAQLILNNDKQQRKTLLCNNKLNEIAVMKLNYILERDFLWHDAGNLTPNQLLRHNGFKLPNTYPIFGNQVEALAGGDGQAEMAFKGLLNSPMHKKLLLGESDFLRVQDQMGVAYINNSNSQYQHYWVVIIADEKDQINQQLSTAELHPPPPKLTKKLNRGKLAKQRMYRNKIRSQLR